jgi:hypothetical protein
LGRLRLSVRPAPTKEGGVPVPKRRKRQRRVTSPPRRSAKIDHVTWTQVIIREIVDALLWWAGRGWRL